MGFVDCVYIYKANESALVHNDGRCSETIRLLRVNKLHVTSRQRSFVASRWVGGENCYSMNYVNEQKTQQLSVLILSSYIYFALRLSWKFLHHTVADHMYMYTVYYNIFAWNRSRFIAPRSPPKPPYVSATVPVIAVSCGPASVLFHYCN